MKHLHLSILYLLLPALLFSQETKPSVYKDLDTLVMYSVSLSSGPAIDCNHFDFKVKKIKYFVDCEEVSEKEYRKYEKANSKIGECKPCYLKTLSKGGALLYEGPSYTDCFVGKITFYYPNGKVKRIESYRENASGRWTGPLAPKFCCIKEGTWTYYDEAGSITKTEVYKDNKLVE